MWISHALTNHLLLQQPELKQALSKLTGRSLRLTALGVNTDMHIREDGYVEAIPADKTFECHISIHASTWSKMVQGEAFGVGDVSITGDTDLAMQLLPVLGQLRYEPYVDATRLFGNNRCQPFRPPIEIAVAQYPTNGESGRRGSARLFARKRYACGVASAMATAQ